MNKRETAALAFWVLALYALLCALGDLGGVGTGLAALFDAPTRSTEMWTISFLAPSLLFFIATVVLWVKADWLAGRMVSDAKADASGERLLPRDVQTIALTLMGL